MTRSLQLALIWTPTDAPFGVLLGDMPAMTEDTIARTETIFGQGTDVAYPSSPEGVAGHPVIFAARARPIVNALPDGDTLRGARDHESLRRATWTCEDRSAFLDVDVPEDWRAFVDA
jgi:CTP:molybdopterin cytidylyltransferase MocA